MVALTIDASIPLTHLSGIQYGNADGRPLLLDAVSPREAFTGAQPAVVWVHGGGWYEGTREDDWFCPYLATHGFFAVSIDYRLSGEAPFPAQIHDVKAAIRWLGANAERYGIDAGRIGIWGDSAGAHLAALAGVTGDLPELEGDVGSPGYSSRVQAVALCSPGTDFLSLGPDVLANPDHPVVWLFGGTVEEKADLMRLASPVAHVTGAAPPFFIVHGTQDETVPFAQAELLYRALVAAGCQAELVPLEGRTHSWTAQIDPPADLWRYWELAPMALPFFKRHLCR